MATPLPWSHSRLADFKNCPRAFYEKQVVKSVVEEKGEAVIWGQEVHKHFEDRLVSGVVLPDMLKEHEPFLAKLESMPGKLTAEERLALDSRAQPCGFFDKDVWFRGVADVKILNGDKALIVDHKTGKVKNNFDQLELFALHTFAAHPEVQLVRVGYYWTKIRSLKLSAYGRGEIPRMWSKFMPDLKQYAQAFREDVWQPRQSGLCNGWCPVTDCEFWRPKRLRS